MYMYQCYIDKYIVEQDKKKEKKRKKKIEKNVTNKKKTMDMLVVYDTVIIAPIY